MIFVAYIFGKKERNRLEIIDFQYYQKKNRALEQQKLRRLKLTIFNAIFTILLSIALLKGWIRVPVLFVIASMIALLVNYPKLGDQRKIMKSYGVNIFMVSSIIFAVAFFLGY